MTDALYRRGYRKLREALEAVPRTDRPQDDLRAVVEAYRATALARPAVYAVMLGSALKEFTPMPSSVEEAAAGFEVLVTAVRRCADPVRVPDPGAAAEVLWGVAHGLVSLQLAGFVVHPHQESVLVQRRCGGPPAFQHDRADGARREPGHRRTRTPCR